MAEETTHKVTRALFPGSFDPFTAGHLNILKRALTMFDQVVVAVGINSDKRGFYDKEKRLDIIQQARASGMKEFPIPYALTNCHNSLCAVGGTINEDDHMFGLSAAKKYGGIYVPASSSRA